MNRTIPAVIAALVVLPTGVALAHTGVEKQYPKRGDLVKRVKTVSVTFDEAFVTGKIVSVTGPSKPSVKTTIAGGKTKLTGKLSGSVKAGTYRVRWRIKADDGDTQTGSWTFRVR